MSSRYDDIIHLPHHVSETRSRMSLHDRAAQFMPFAALTGYDAAILETARLTENRVELAEDRQATLNARLALVQEHLKEEPEIAIVYFVPDARKEGGAYRTVVGRAKKIDPIERRVIMQDGTGIPMEDIYTVESDLFEKETVTDYEV